MIRVGVFGYVIVVIISGVTRDHAVSAGDPTHIHTSRVSTKSLNLLREISVSFGKFREKKIRIFVF